MFAETQGSCLEDSAKSTTRPDASDSRTLVPARILGGPGSDTTPPVLWQSRRQTNLPGAPIPCLYARDKSYCHAENAISPNMLLYALPYRRYESSIVSTSQCSARTVEVVFRSLLFSFPPKRLPKVEPGIPFCTLVSNSETGGYPMRSCIQSSKEFC